MRRFPMICDPADCKRCDVRDGSAECLLRKAQVCMQLMGAPIARRYHDEIEKLSFEMIEEAGVVVEHERLACEDAVVVPFARKREN